MSIVKILKREEDVDQKTYILWTLPSVLLLTAVFFLDTEAGEQFFVRFLMEVPLEVLVLLLFLTFAFLGLSIFLSGRRFVLFQQSGYHAFWMLLVPGFYIVWIYLAFKKDLFYLEESRKQ